MGELIVDLNNNTVKLKLKEGTVQRTELVDDNYIFKYNSAYDLIEIEFGSIDMTTIYPKPKWKC